MQERGFGDDISTNTIWTGSLNERSWFTPERYAPYRRPGNVKVPFWLQPEKSYVGVAWYQREVMIPQSWSGKRVVVRFERAHWGTTLWLDDRKIGERDALGTPHEYDLGTAVSPGQHRLTVRVDNRELIAVGADAHSISDHTQGNWNGVAGRLELVATDAVWFADVRVFPDATNRRARVTVQLGNATGKSGSGALKVTVTSPYLKSFVVARVNPIRFRSEDAPPLSFDEALARMTKAAEKFNPDKVKMDDLAKSGGAPEDGD